MIIICLCWDTREVLQCVRGLSGAHMRDDFVSLVRVAHTTVHCMSFPKSEKPKRNETKTCKMCEVESRRRKWARQKGRESPRKECSFRCERGETNLAVHKAVHTQHSIGLPHARSQRVLQLK